jgi:putative hemolysin
MAPEPILLFVLVGLFFISAFFAAAEAALIALNKVRLRHLMEAKKGGAKRLYGITARMDKFIATNHPEGVAFSVRHLVSLLIFLLQPVTNFLTWASNGVIRLFGGNPHSRSPLVTEEEIKMMITIGREEGFYGDQQRKMLERVFHFDEISVRDVMTPLEKITSIPLNIAQDELERVLMEEGHNRIPVYDEKKDNIIGILYVRDLIYLIKNSSLIQIADLISAPYFVSANKKVNELLKEFQAKKIQIAIVKDDKTHKTTGLVTLEDLVEEIVGEIEEVAG